MRTLCTCVTRSRLSAEGARTENVLIFRKLSHLSVSKVRKTMVNLTGDDVGNRMSLCVSVENNSCGCFDMQEMSLPFLTFSTFHVLIVSSKLLPFRRDQYHDSNPKGSEAVRGEPSVTHWMWSDGINLPSTAYFTRHFSHL